MSKPSPRADALRAMREARYDEALRAEKAAAPKAPVKRRVKVKAKKRGTPARG